MLIEQADMENGIHDVRIRGRRIAEIAPSLPPKEGETVIPAGGGALLPGLHDHHIHLNATAAALASLPCGPPDISSEAELAHVLNRAAADRTASDAGWLRGVGYYPFAGNEPDKMIDRNWLDENGPDCPVRIQHRSGRLWILNAAGLDALLKNGAELSDGILASGHIYDGDVSVRNALASDPPDLSKLVRRLLAFGITGVTEVTPHNMPEDFLHYARYTGPLKVSVMGRPELAAVSASDCENGRLHVGAVKLHYHDHDLPALADLTEEVAQAHRQGRGVAAHCVTLAELMLTLAAVEAAGPGEKDRIEHAAVVPDETMDRIRQLGLGIVTQPHFIVAREEAYKRDVEADEHASLWRLGAFQRNGIAVAAGSDAPFGDFNPWLGMQAAVDRPADFDRGESVAPEKALALYTKSAGDMRRPRQVKTGEIADLCLLRQNRAGLFGDFAAARVVMTLIDGEIAYDAFEG